MAALKATYFTTPGEFRAWLAQHHATKGELLVGFHRKDSGRPSMTWPESVDQALCYGWIDGVRRNVDEIRYTIRFSPRRPTSIWSAINIRRVGELTELGLMHPAGLAAFGKRRAHKSAIYAYEQRKEAVFPPPLLKTFKSARKAWTFFQDQPPGYRQLMTFWVASAKKDETRQKRMTTLIDACAAGKRLR